jgi:ribosomal protein S18 acetylase RimI-like enzyme
MNIEFKDLKKFTEHELQDLFLSVGWLSGNYPERLVNAIKNSSTVLSAWNNGRLVGLANVLDDGELTAYVHYLLVNPEYQNRGIGTTLINSIKEKYKSYLYLFLVAEDKKLIEYYQRYGFSIIEGTTPMGIMNK